MKPLVYDLIPGMISVHKFGDDPCVCPEWNNPAKKYNMGISVNFEKGLLCSKCKKKLNKEGLSWIKEGFSK